MVTPNEPHDDDPVRLRPHGPEYAWERQPVATFIATVAGIGFLPGGPGTYAAAVFTPLIVWMSGWPLLWRLAALTAVTVASIPAADACGRALGEHDSNHIVIDEVIGVWVALVWFSELSWAIAVVGFVLFRILDVTKPPPARRIDNLGQGGLAVIADDIVAGLWAVPLVWLFAWWW